MPPKFVQIPVKIVKNEIWGELSFFGRQHEFCGENIKIRNEKFSFIGEHRVRLCTAKGNVHWHIPQGVNLDISQVTPANNPPRRLPK